MHAYVGRFQENAAACGQARVEKIGGNFILRIDRDGAAASEVFEVDAMAASAKAQLDAVMSQAFPLQSRAYARLREQIDCVLFEQAGADALLDVLAAVSLDDDRVDSSQVEKVRQH